MIRSVFRMIRYLFPLTYLLSITVLSYLYKLTNTMDRPLHKMELPIDELIPFLEIFIVPYIIWYPFIFLSYIFFFFKNRMTYYRILIGSIIGHLICYATYMLYQTTVPRPDITNETWLLRMVQFIYDNDKPVNAFPSIHVFTTYVMMRAYAAEHVPGWLQWIIQSIGVSIILSTVFVKQHFIIDIFGGVLLGEVLYRIMYRSNLLRLALPVRKATNM